MPFITVSAGGRHIDRSIDDAIEIAKLLTLLQAEIGPLDYDISRGYLGDAGMRLLSVQDDTDPVQVVYVHNGIAVQVQADSELDLIRRDWDRVRKLCIEGPIGPHPKPRLSVPEHSADYFTERSDGARSLRDRRRRLLNALADVTYLPPPLAEVSFDYQAVEISDGTVHFISRQHFDHLPFGTPLLDLHRKEVRKGIDMIDTTPFRGFMTVGFPNPIGPYQAPYRTE